MADIRIRKTARRRGTRITVDPAARRKWRLAHKLARYSLTQEEFDLLLKAQGCACGLCNTPFLDGRPIFIDHDHTCCHGEKSACGKCIRGLLCLAVPGSAWHAIPLSARSSASTIWRALTWTVRQGSRPASASKPPEPGGPLRDHALRERCSAKL
jgi:Recombination endonuclease VII